MLVLRVLLFGCVFTTAAMGATAAVDGTCQRSPTAATGNTQIAASCVNGNCCGKQGCWTSCECW